ncbi:cholera enterotoxin%2C A subunit [Vibrio cholerae]
MSNTCDEKTQSLGVKFLDEYQSKVKRQIFSGYQSDIDTHNRIKDEL